MCYYLVVAHAIDATAAAMAYRWQEDILIPLLSGVD